MAAQVEQKKAHTPEVCRDLMCSEEWKDPQGRVVLGEYHKEGLEEELPQVEQDLDYFEKYWRKKGAINVKGEYHKEGSPHMEEPSEWEGHALRSSDGMENLSTPSPPKAPAQKKSDGKKTASAPKAKEPEHSTPEERKTIDRPIDLATAEVISYALFRMAFRQGLSIPIKREGMVDMNVTFRGKDILINTNQLFYSVPELSVWRIVYSHQGKPILEMGRGVKNGMRIYRFNALVFLLQMWRGSVEQRKLRAKLKAEQGGEE